MNTVISQDRPDVPELLVCVDSKGTATVRPFFINPDLYATSTSTETFPAKPASE
jgi:hypothetical protein